MLPINQPVVFDIAEITRLPLTDDKQAAAIAKASNSKRANVECTVRGTCKLPVEYCSKGLCEDWFF